MIFICVNNIFSQEIKINLINKSTFVKKNINFELINNSSKKVFYLIGLEKKNKEWKEIISDIKHPNSKVSEYRFLYKFSKFKKSVKISTLKNLNNRDVIDCYRLSVAFRYENDTILHNEYSNSFTIVKK